MWFSQCWVFINDTYQIKFKEYDTYQIKLIKKLFECVVKNECKKYLWFMKQLVFISFEKWYLNKRTHACKMYIHCKSQLQSAFAPKPKYLHFCKFKNKCYRSVANSLKHVSFRELFYNLITEASNYTYRLHIYNPYYRSLKIEIEIGTPDS